MERGGPQEPGPEPEPTDPPAQPARAPELRRLAFALMLVTFALLPLQNLRLTSAVTISDLALVATAVVVALSRYRTGPRRPFPVPYLLGVGLMAVGGAVGLLFAGTLRASALVDLRLAMVIALTAFVAVQVAPSGAEVVRLLTAFVVVGGGNAILSALGAATGWPVIDRFAFGDRAIGITLSSDSLLDAVRGADAPRALDTNPNLFGAIAVVGAVVALVLTIEATSRAQRLLLGAATGGLVLGVLYSGSRSALIALGIGVIPAVWRLAHRVSRQVVASVALALAAVVLIALVGTVRVPSLDRLLLRENTDASARTTESTLDRYQSSSQGIEERGWNSFLTGSGLRNEPAAALHDGHLEVWLGLGLLGSAGWVLICGWTARPAVELIAVRGALERRQTALMAVGSGFIANIAVMLFVDTVWNRYIWLLVALALTLHLRPQGAPPPGPAAEADVAEVEASA